jgi:hypothetical protein
VLRKVAVRKHLTKVQATAIIPSMLEKITNAKYIISSIAILLIGFSPAVNANSWECSSSANETQASRTSSCDKKSEYAPRCYKAKPEKCEIKEGAGDTEWCGGEGKDTNSKKCETIACCPDKKCETKEEGSVEKNQRSSCSPLNEGDTKKDNLDGGTASTKTGFGSKGKKVGPANTNCDATSDDGERKPQQIDPVSKGIIDSIIKSKKVSEAIAYAAERGHIFSVTGAVVDQPRDRLSVLQGIDAPLAGFSGKGKTLVFTLKLAKPSPGSHKGGGNRITGTAGVYPDPASAIRNAISQEASKINGMLYEAAAYSKARLIGELELAALSDKVTYENIRVEVGNGEVEKLAEARARALQAEIDIMDLSRKIQVLSNNFVTMTGKDHRSVTLEDYSEFFQLVPQDPDFATIFETVAESSSSTDEGAADFQRKANDLLHQGGELMARRFCVDAASEALRKTREKMDNGESNEAEEAAAKALFLGSQKKELQALGEYAGAHCNAYPNVKFVVDTNTQPSVSISGAQTNPSQDKPGVLWLAAIGLGALALLAYFGAGGRGGGVDNKNTGGQA